MTIVLCIYIWLQDLHGVSHHLGRFDHLRQEHLSLTEHLSDSIHACHERAFYDGCSAAILRDGFHEVGLKSVCAAFYESVLQAGSKIFRLIAGHMFSCVGFLYSGLLFHS